MVAISFSNLPLKAQVKSTEKPASFYSILQHYSTEDGLALSSVACSCCDRYGNLWFGTSGGGVSCYNGKSFVNYSTGQGLLSNSIECILEDRSGNMWFGTNGGGVSRFDGKNIITFTTAQGLLNNSVESIVQDQSGMIWLGTSGGGLSRYDGQSLPAKSKSCFVNFTVKQGLANDIVWSAVSDHAGKLWFGTDGGGLSCYDGKQFINYSTAQGLPGNGIWCLHVSRTGTLWIGTNGNGVCRFDGKTFEKVGASLGLAGKRILSLGEDIAGNIWIGTDGAGIIRVNPQGNVLPGGKDGLSMLTVFQGLPSNKILCMVTDHSGNLWLGTDGAGVACYEGDAFLNIGKDQGLPNSIVWSVAEDRNGNRWFGTDGGGVAELNPQENTFHNFSLAQGLVSNNILSVIIDKEGNLWFGSGGKGVNRLSADLKTMKNFNNQKELFDASVLCMLQDRLGNIWFGKAIGGVVRYDGNTFTEFDSASSGPGGNPSVGLGSNGIQCMMQDRKGNIWFGSNGGGLFRYDGKELVNYSKIQGLSNNSVMCLLEDPDGQLWIGTNGGGLSRFSATGSTFLNFTAADGLPDDAVTQLIQDKSGTIWIGTSKGISSMKFKNHEPKFVIYSSRTGYPVKDVNAGQGGMFIDSKGIIWIGTGDDKTALVRFNPGALNANSQPPLVIIQSVKVNDRSINDASPDFKLVLPYEDNNISFEFCAIETGRPKLVNYQYMLEGYTKTWSAVTKSDKAGFGNINEGTYTFRLKAQSPFGIWSSPISFTFKVLPPWYRTWWIYLCYGLLTLAGIWGINRWLTSRLRLENKVLEFEQKALRSQMNPHFIFNSLNSIQNYISGNDTETAEIFLSRFARLIRNILSSSRKSFVLLEDEIKVMKDYLELEKLQYDHRFGFSFDLDPEIDPENIEIPSMLIQPYLENAVLHGLSAKSGKGHVSVRFSLKKNTTSSGQNSFFAGTAEPLLICEIEDDGIGRDKARELKLKKGIAHQSLAMSLTKERLELLNKKNKKVISVRIEDLHNSSGDATGTKITLSIPFQEIS